jgi:proteasome assembly chaperone (PAC2) family protein
MQAIRRLIDDVPPLNRPVLIAGFDGWGNALSISTGMVDYLIRRLKAEKLAVIDSDVFYRYDEARPQVSIVNGSLIDFSPPGGALFAAQTGEHQRDIVIFKGNEPNLSWNLFVKEILEFCEELKIDTMITLGSMFDQVRHTERVISGVASSEALFSRLARHGVTPISYQGPSAVHSIFQVKGPEKGVQSMSLWCHCPFYIQCAQHFGYLAKLGTLLSAVAQFDLDISDLNRGWEKLQIQIEQLIEDNTELQAMIRKMEQMSDGPTVPNLKPAISKDQKIIDLRDFLPTRPQKNEE